MDRVTVKVQRGEKGSERYWETYEVPRQEGVSICATLTYINRHHGAGISYYYSCLRGRRMGCIFKVNGKSTITCITPLEGDVQIEPASVRTAIKDLLPSAKYPLP